MPGGDAHTRRARSSRGCSGGLTARLTISPSAYDGVLAVDGGVGDEGAYDPGAWGTDAEMGMAARVA